MKCPLCRDLIPANALRCSHCAGDLTDQAVKTKIDEQVTIHQKKVKILVGVLLVFFGFIFISIISSGSSPQPATQNERTSALTPDRMHSSVRAMADFMVKDDNKIGLRMWAQSIGVSAPDFASAATLRANISRASNDFSLYRNKDEFTKLVSTLSNTDAMFIEVLNESMR